MDRIKGRLKEGLFLFMLVAFFAASGCAPIKPVIVGDKPEAPPKAEEKPGATAVKMISVVGTGDGVLIEVNGPVKYTTFSLSDPPRIIIDIPGVGMEAVQSPIAVDNNYISEIVASSYGEDNKKIGRVEIGIKEGITSNIKSGEDSILVDFKRDVYIPGGAPVSAEEVKPAEEAAAAPKAEEVAPVEAAAAKVEEVPAPEATAAPVVEAPAPVAEAPAPVAEAPATPAVSLKPAKTILKVTASLEGDMTIVTIEGDGEFGNYNSFGLDNPTRAVLDIWGVATTVAKKEISVTGPHIRKVRIGAHSDKVRLVFDSPLKSLPLDNVEKAGKTLIVRFGAKQKAASAEAKAETPIVKKEAAAPPVLAAPDKETITVRDISFKRVNGKARLSIANSSKTAYEVKESMDGKSVTVDIFNAFIPEDLRMTLDAADLNTPVKTVSSYQVSGEPESHVRVLVKLSDKAPYEVKGENGTINVDFAVPSTPAPVEKAEKAEAAPIAAAPEAAKEAQVSQTKYTGRKIDLDMIDIKVTDLLKLLAEVSNLNIIASEDVTGTITLRLKNVPWDQAFELVLKTKNLASEREGNIVRVAPKDKLRKETEEKLAAKKAEEKLEDLETEYIRINYDKAQSLSAQLKNILTDRGSVTVHETTNTLIVKDTRKAIEDVKSYVKRVDIPIPQVLIEARIVEAASSFARDLGIQWGIDARTKPSADSHVGLFGSSDTMGQGAPTPDQQSALFAGGGVQSQDKATGFTADTGVTNYAVSLPATLSGAGALGLIFGKTGSNPLLLDLRISAGENQGLLKTISRPRIVTMDNKEAKIQQGESIPYETSSAAGTSTIFVDANLSLTVKPQITPDGSVLMDIKVSRNAPGTISTASGKKSIDKKEATTNVLVKDGETTVLGGIIISDTINNEKGIPLLKDIPYLGWLFKNRSVSDSQKELLIFITPTIMKDGKSG